MKLKSTELIIPLIVAVIAFSGGLLAGFISEDDSSSDKIDHNYTNNISEYTNHDYNNSEEKTEEKNNTQKEGNMTVSLTIDYQNGTIKTYDISTKKETVYDILIQAASQYNFQVESTYYGQYGSYFIEKIGSRSNGEENRYWTYYLNGEYGSLGANLQKVNNMDKITWSFDLSQF